MKNKLFELIKNINQDVWYYNNNNYIIHIKSFKNFELKERYIETIGFLGIKLKKYYNEK